MKAVVLAGGSGTRLWPMSRRAFPKQFLKIVGEESFLQKTLRRLLALLPAEDILIVTHGDFYHEVMKQAGAVMELLDHQVIIEPMSKNTAPAIALAICDLPEDTLVLVAPSDHLIAPEEPFCKTILEAVPLAIEGQIVTFGVRPTRPETGYGYIKEGRFIEKPSLDKRENMWLMAAISGTAVSSSSRNRGYVRSWRSTALG